MMADFTDFQIEFRLAKKLSSDGTQSTHEVLAMIDGTGSWRGESTIDDGQLAEAEQDPRQYGTRLGEFLFNPTIMNALRQARGLQERPVRIRLWLEMGPSENAGISMASAGSGPSWSSTGKSGRSPWPPSCPFRATSPPNPSIRMPPMTPSSACWSRLRVLTT